MRIDDDALLYIYWDAVLTFDPTGTTVALDISGTAYAMSWLGSAVQVGSTWTQTARSNMKFGGSSVTVSNPDVKLTAGPPRLMGEPIVTTSDGQKVPCFPVLPIDVT